MRRITLSLLFSLAAAAATTGCSTIESKVYSTPPQLPVVPARETPLNGAIAAPSQNLALFEDTKAHNVGDLLTIELVESTTAQKSASTDTSKTDDVSLPDVRVMGRDLHTNAVFTGKRAFAGKGDSAQSNKLQGSITVEVVQRLANGELVVQGEKQVELNQGMEFVKLQGVVRPADISSDNTVTSDRVANARISYTGRGQLADANAQGWLTRFFNSPWMPF
jgi:flagellar L-ring protein precursor FlgH